MLNLKSIWFPLLSLATLALVECGERAVEWGGHVVEEDGVVRIENPVEPLATPGTIVPNLLWSSTGPVDGDIWETPRQVHVGDDVIFLADRQAGKIHRLSTDGALLPSFGEPGEGPGQYGRLIDAIPEPHGLFVVDAGNGRVEVLGPQGGVRESILLDQFVFSAVPLGPDTIAVFGAVGLEERWQRITADGGRDPWSFPTFQESSEAKPPPSRPVGWGDRPVQMELRVPRLWVYSPTGELERVIHIPFPPEVASEAELGQMAQQVADVLAGHGVSAQFIQEQVDQMKERLRVKSRFRDACFDEGAGLIAILEQNPEDFGAGPATLHLLSSQGVYLAALPFQEAWADFDLKDGILYALARDPLTDLVTLQVYGLDIPASLMERGRGLAVPGTLGP